MIQQDTYLVEPDWDMFANSRELGKPFFESIKDQKIATTLIQDPPSFHVIADDHLRWEKAVPVESVQDLFGAIRRVRNNLFHGGKAASPAAPRNLRLITDAQDVIEESLRRHLGVYAAFRGEL